MALLYGIWNEKMALGIREIDEHHKTLLQLIMRTKEAMAAGNSSEAVKRILSELKSYANYHFKAEERLMLNRKFGGLADHRLLHRDFIVKVEDLETHCSSNPAKINLELLQFLTTWFVDHILKEDRLFVVAEA